MARPTNNVLVMDEAESGCCAMELKAEATARPSPSAGPILPSPIQMPADMIDAAAVNVMLSIIFMLRD